MKSTLYLPLSVGSHLPFNMVQFQCKTAEIDKLIKVLPNILLRGKVDTMTLVMCMI